MTQYHLVTNSVQPQQVRKTADAYIIEDVPFIKPMELSGGYVPRANIEAKTPLWDGVSSTLRHARNAQGKPIPASRRPDLQLGSVEEPYFDGEYTRANIRVEKDRLDAVDGADTLRTKLENGEPINVSSQYAPAPLEPGEYDGAYRSNVERIVRPDSVALLPEKRGRCSIEDGCGINPQLVANAEVHVPMTRNAAHGEDMDATAVGYELTAVAPDDVEQWTDDEWDGDAAVAAMPNPSEDDDAPAVLDQTHAVVPTDDDTRDSKANWKLPIRESPDAPVNTRALVAIDARLGQTEGFGDPLRERVSEWASAMLAAAPDDLFGAAGDGDQSANVLERLGRQVLDGLGLTDQDSHETVPAESGADPSPSMDRDTLIDEITANSALTEAALEERCDDGLEAIHNDIMTDNNGGGDDPADDDYVTQDELDALREEIPTADEIAEQVTANRDETKKDELATEIVANSAEYDDADTVREDYPTEAALETKRDQVTAGGGVPTAGGIEANLGDDGPDIDVSSGLLGVDE